MSPPDTHEPEFERRLAAVLVADVAGFSALAGSDEERTIRSFRAHMAVLEPIVAMHSGRVVKSTGDGFLAEYASVVDAVSCAAELQRQMADRNRHEDPDWRIEFRIGVHCGDIVADGDDILGDGVNIAARLEAVSPPGGIAVSERVRDDVAGKLDIAFRDIGPIALKNIADPVRVHLIGPATDLSRRVDVPLPGKPSVAVLPFRNMNPQDHDDYFADGVTEDITIALAQVPWVFVIARNSAFRFRGLSVDPRDAARELGVRYILVGSIRRSRDRLRIVAELLDAETGAVLWANRYDGRNEDVFDLQDEISAGAVTAIAPEIQNAEIKRVLRKPTNNLDAYDMYLRGQHALHLGRVEDAANWFDRALVQVPGFAKARAKRAWIATFRHYFGKSATGDSRVRSLDHARTALETEPDDPEVLAHCGYTIGFLDRNPAYGRDLVESATQLAPSFAWAWASSSLLCAYLGAAEEALDRGANALRLSPYDPFSFRVYIAQSLASVIREDHAALLELATRGASLNPRPINFHYHRAIALAHLGRHEEATQARDRVLAIDPGFRIGTYLDYCVNDIGTSDALNRPLEAGLRKAGFPE